VASSERVILGGEAVGFTDPAKEMPPLVSARNNTEEGEGEGEGRHRSKHSIIAQNKQ
jgi:hypothetical protein